MPEETKKEGGQDPSKQEPKSSSAFAKKIIKIVTVMAYISGVSGAGFLLSLYYIFFWNSNITGVRPPGYLKSGERMGLPHADRHMAPLPDAYSGRHPIAHPHKMSKEFMEAYFNNYTEDAADRVLGMMEGDPTPKVLPVAGDEIPTTHAHTQPPPPPTLNNNNFNSFNQPSNSRADSSSSLSSSSSSSQQQRHHTITTLQQRQERQERHQQRARYSMQGDALTTAP